MLSRSAGAVLLLAVSTPASAQDLGGADFGDMEQFAPVLEVIKKQMGKRRFGELVRTVGPIMDEMTTGQDSAGGGGFGSFEGFDAARIMPHINAQTIEGLVRAFGPDEKPRKRKKRARF